ncbi:phage late control D family protein [Cupriavidus oxalaticus]|uniref:Bacteriophage P2 tail protein GPD n=1 Tax=Cupriavidus oxalaticus TaxID=96344 RepID=A0A375G1A2_9BURK|nr:phage late control D family protein [Cupriavidus oxalaticus]QRQ88500.1 phage late control D family protein [Cupriavidus oxalaticus]QRQ93174.1 phage late control D family protein [Cupriavidus oxalaticus]WQD81784.1 phage late control D family protein [Cupriavidus oxalaticus]SPC13154.1 Bacteriophage P2 tail protein GPD [Cupriavidus oxalaticus]
MTFTATDLGEALISDVPQPAYTLALNGQDISGRFRGRLIGLTLVDNRGFEADQLDIELDDHDGMLELPEKGVHLSLGLGWADTGVVDKGRYKVDELEHTGPPDRLTIRARSADLGSDLTTRKERSFRDKTIGAIVRAIAGKNELVAVIAAKLANQVVEHLDQTGESDANLLTRMAKDYDAIATVKQGKLLFIKAGEALSASGIPLPTVLITRASGDTHSFMVADRDNYNGVKAFYQDTRLAKKGEVVIDASNAVAVKEAPAPSKGRKKRPTAKPRVTAYPNPDNVKVLRHTYATKANAERAARAEWARMQRGVANFSITLARGRPDLFPELPAVVSGWKPQIDNTGWTITKVTHHLTERGYITTLELEIKPAELQEEAASDAPWRP